MHYNVDREFPVSRNSNRSNINRMVYWKSQGEVKAFILYRELTFKYATNRNWNDSNICFSFSPFRSKSISLLPPYFVRFGRKTLAFRNQCNSNWPEKLHFVAIITVECLIICFCKFRLNLLNFYSNHNSITFL